MVLRRVEETADGVAEMNGTTTREAFTPSNGGRGRAHAAWPDD